MTVPGGFQTLFRASLDKGAYFGKITDLCTQELEGDVDLLPHLALLGPPATVVIASTDNNVYLAWRITAWK